MSKPGQGCGQGAPGELFVDERCIGCMVCTEIAPDIFLCDSNQESVFVGRQPVLKEEITRCKEAENICPVDAIGKH